jgi:hypothetical protein
LTEVTYQLSLQRAQRAQRIFQLIKPAYLAQG